MRGAALRRGLAAVGGGGLLVLLSVFVYNSGFGHDALEYLVIGRSLVDGYPLYAYVPSKSWGLYVLAAAFLSIPGAGSHLGTALLVVGLIVLVAVVTLRIIGRHFGSRAGWLAAGLVGLAAVFMELNYFQPEPLVFVCGLLAFGAMTSTVLPGWRRAGLAGVWLGIGMAFKSVAGFYLVACAWCLLQREGGSAARWRAAAPLIGGFGLAVALPAAYFAATGRIESHLHWSYWFPLFGYPANGDWLAKLYTKLLWVWVVAGSAVVLWRRLPGAERDALRADMSVLVGMGLVALLPLWKTQASHYAFPGAALLLIASAVTVDRWLARGAAVPVILWSAAVLLLGLASGLAYRPAAAQRFMQVRSWEEERALASAVQALVGPDEFVLSLGEGARLYWLARRYPNWPLVNTEVQTTDLVARDGASLLEAFDDPQLALVEFDPARPRFDDPRFLRDGRAAAFVRAIESRLSAGFKRRDDVLPPLVFWVREPAAADAGGPR